MDLLRELTLRGSGLVDRELYYVAPEVLIGQRPDVVSDIYTIGALAYEMVTSSVPLLANTLPELIGLTMLGAPRDPRELNPGLPAHAAAALLRALASDRAKRHASARELRTELRAI